MSGIELEPVDVPATSGGFNISYGSEVYVDDDAKAGSYQYGIWGNQQDLKAFNPYGFRAVWLP